MASVDPVPAVFQLLAVAEADAIDEDDRELLAALKRGLRSAGADGTHAGWSIWYREALDTIRLLAWRWSARRAESPSIAVSNATLSEAASGRLKEAPGAFVQRWIARLQDQTHQVRDRLIGDVTTTHVRERETSAQVLFDISSEDRAAFGQRTSGVLNAWSAQVSARLTPSWHEWLAEIATEEHLPPATSRPPAWPDVHLGTSARLVPHVDAGVTRRLTPFTALMRAMSTGRGFASMGVAAIGPVVGAIIGSKSGDSATASLVGAGAGTALTALIAIPFGIIYARSIVRDELEHARHDHAQRQRAVLHSWINTTVEAHRARMASAITTSVQEARARLGPWIEQSWNATANRGASPALAGRELERESLGPLLSNIGMARNALAARLAQLELQVAT